MHSSSTPPLSSNEKLISVHFPKVGGSTLRHFYKKHFHGRYHEIYNDYPAESFNANFYKACVNSIRMFNTTPHYKCTHGHFLPLKFRYCSNVRFSAFFREPVERITSHFYHHMNKWHPDTIASLNPVTIEPYLLAFAKAEKRRNVYAKYLRGFPIHKFSYIGITEDYNNSMISFFNFLQIEPETIIEAKRQNPLKVSQRYNLTESTKNQIIELNRKDVSIYENVLRVYDDRYYI
tara:strand:+ start:1185 stop:1886 length:702 start_codon:yes stop_codon:yes gene_type:complete